LETFRRPSFDRSADFEDPMSRIFQTASAAAVGLTVLTAVAMTVPGLAQNLPGDVIFEPGNGVDAAPAADTLSPDTQSADTQSADTQSAVPLSAESLDAMVAATEHREPENEDLRCIATGVFFESANQALEGQLAVANVILNRVESGRFAATPCAVLTQRGQFSFVRRGVVPTPPNDRRWQRAVAVARIAAEDRWNDPVPGALFFHATYVSPGWNRPRVARLGDHIFYR
jgi:spore germination cell wall hydrolase CwlJ-like protein